VGRYLKPSIASVCFIRRFYRVGFIYEKPYHSPFKGIFVEQMAEN